MELKQILFILFVIGSLGFFAWTVMSLMKFFAFTKPLDRMDNYGTRAAHTLAVAFGQTKILRRPVAGLLHAIVFWGFLAITVGTAEMLIDGVLGTERVLKFLGPVYDFITISGEIFAVLIIVACVIFLIRRYIIKPARFTAPEMKPSSRNDATGVLFMIMLLMLSLLGMNLGYINEAEDPAGIFPVVQGCKDMLAGWSAEAIHTFHEINWWIHIVLVLVFLNILPYSKHFHVLLSVPNVFFHSVESAGKIANMESVKQEIALMMNPDAMPAEELGEPERFGIKDVEDVTWKSLMDSYTCTECGRCTASCPANITGKKLSPRKLFIDLRARMKEKGPEKVKDANFDDNKSLFDYITPEELWGCTTCGACMQECPVDIEHIPFIVGMRRYMVMEESSAPAELNAMFTNIENNGAPWAMPASARFDWAQGISMPANK